MNKKVSPNKNGEYTFLDFKIHIKGTGLVVEDLRTKTEFETTVKNNNMHLHILILKIIKRKVIKDM